MNKKQLVRIKRAVSHLVDAEFEGDGEDDHELIELIEKLRTFYMKERNKFNKR